MLRDAITNYFTSLADPDHVMIIVLNTNHDIRVTTSRLGDDGPFENSSVHYRTIAGGGHNILILDILSRLENKNFKPGSYPEPIPTPSEFSLFLITNDLNPGSHLGIAIAENAFGLQTNCHNEAADHRCGLLSVQGDGAMVWLHRKDHPQIYAELKAYLVEGKQPDPALYGAKPIKFLDLTANP